MDVKKVRLPEVLDDKVYLEILSKLKGSRVSDLRKEVQSQILQRKEVLRISKSEVPNLVKVGTGFVKYAHKLWKLKKSDNGFFLERTSPEKEEFDNSVDVSAENLYSRLRKE